MIHGSVDPVAAGNECSGPYDNAQEKFLVEADLQYTRRDGAVEW